MNIGAENSIFHRKRRNPTNAKTILRLSVQIIEMISQHLVVNLLLVFSINLTYSLLVSDHFQTLAYVVDKSI